MNTFFLCQKLGTIAIGQLDDAIEIIEKINTLLDNTAFIDENTTGKMLEEIYISSTPDIKSKLRTTSILKGNAILEVINEIDRLKSNELMLRDKDDKAIDTLTGAIVIGILILSCILIYSHTGLDFSGESYEDSLTVKILKGIFNIVTFFL